MDEQLFQYHCRRLQISSLKVALLKKIEQVEREKQHALTAISALLGFSPIEIEVYFSRADKEQTKSFYERARVGAVLLLKRSDCQKIFEQLEMEVGDPLIGFHILSLDLVDKTVDPAIEQVFAKFPELLLGIYEAGRIMAIEEILGIVKREDIPLMRYRRDLMERRFKLEATIDGGGVKMLETVIPEIYIRYYYPPNNSYPELSILIRPVQNL